MNLVPLENINLMHCESCSHALAFVATGKPLPEIGCPICGYVCTPETKIKVIRAERAVVGFVPARELLREFAANESLPVDAETLVN